MEIQLHFDDPDLVSGGERKDLLIIRINAQEMLQDIEGNYIDLAYKMVFELPLQINES